MPFADLDTTAAHLRHGIKTGIACVLSYLMTLLFDLPYGFWAVLSTVIVMQINVADSIRMCWYRFSGTALGAVIGIVTILLFPGDPVMTTIGTFCSTAFCAYMTRYNARYRMAAITVVVVFLGSLGDPNRVIFALYRIVEIAIGVGSAFLVTVLIWPLRVGKALSERLTSQFERCATKYETLVQAFLSRQSRVPADILVQLDSDVSQDKELFRKMLAHERMFISQNPAQLSLKVDTLEKTVDHMHSLLHALNDVSGDGYDIIMRPELTELCEVTQEALRAIGNDAPYPAQTLETAVRKAETRLIQLRDEGATKRFDLRKFMQVLAFINSVLLLGEELLVALQRRNAAPK